MIIFKIWSLINKKRKKQYYLLIILMFFSSVSEIVSIGMVIPFITALTSPEKILNIISVKEILVHIGIEKSEELLLPLTILFISSVLISTFIRMMMLIYSTKLSFSTGAELGQEIFKIILKQNYEKHINRSSSEVLHAVITQSESTIQSGIRPILNIFSNSLTIVLAGIIIFVYEPKATILLISTLTLIYFLIIKISKKTLINNSKIISNNKTKRIILIQESIGAIKEIIINSSINYYLNKYKKYDDEMRNAQIQNTYIGESPRYILESTGIIIIAIIAWISIKDKQEITLILPFLGALVLGAQRILPLLQQAYQNLALIRSSQQNILDTIENLEYKNNIKNQDPLNEEIQYANKIKFQNVSYSYGENKNKILEEVNFEIIKGNRVGIKGNTGTGKSTLINLLMGLLKPTNGCLFIDDKIMNEKNIKSWQQKIAHVPQHIFLSETSIYENIAFGLTKEEIDKEKVYLVSKIAEIYNTVNKLNDGFDTNVGERGIRLSGGQLQRIGIARALYKNADVLILDEATSALDVETEAKIIDNIYKINNKITIIMIAHRISTLEKCDLYINFIESNHVKIIYK